MNADFAEMDDSLCESMPQLSLVKFWLAVVFQQFFLPTAQPRDPSITYDENLRPQFHYTTSMNWLSDPNGLFTYGDTHHLFYQYNPTSRYFMMNIYWGHATSKDWLHWDEQEVAVPLNEKGAVFTGSGMVDERNASGFQTTAEHKAIILMYTRRSYPNGSDPFLEEQYLSYSNDGGKTFKHQDTPTINNPNGATSFSFRDPKFLVVNGKVMVAISSTLNVLFYESDDFRNWNYLSKFGENYGAHDGEFEGPDLIELPLEGEKYWILLANLTPERQRTTGTPNGGSGPQYFIGKFTQKQFKTDQDPKLTRWVEYGPDCFAGWLWFGTNRFVCWASNWYYAASIPTFPWRGQMVMFRDLRLVRGKNNVIYLASTPIDLTSLRVADSSAHGGISGPLILKRDFRAARYNLTHNLWEINLSFDFRGLLDEDYFQFCSSNRLNEKVCVKFFPANETYMIDRSLSGDTFFGQEAFTLFPTAPRLVDAGNLMSNWTILLDTASIELFADDGLTTMTAVFFPTEHFTNFIIELVSDDMVTELKLLRANFYALKSIWKK